MSIYAAREREHLSQNKFITRITAEIRSTEMLTVYCRERRANERISIFCSLIPTSQLESSLSSPTWDLSMGSGMPGSCQYWENGKPATTRYLRFGEDKGIEPLVIYREFHGTRHDYVELSEEFRHFHRLYHDRKQDHFIKIDDAGDEHIVATVEDRRVRVRLLEIRQFLAIKEMHLGIFFDSTAQSPAKLKELRLVQGLAETHHSEQMTYTLAYGDYGGTTGMVTFSRLLGKRLIAPLPKDQSGFWGFSEEEPKQHVDFIIGVNEAGKDIIHGSDPDTLANFFGANPTAPNYLTPVHFRKGVLDKYYQQPSKYSVEPGYLRCGGLWGMTMDNHHEDKVVAWLGDLGRDLRTTSKLHWRSYNIPPAGGVSKVFFQQQLMAVPTDSEQPEHVFKSVYHNLAAVSTTRLGWTALLPLDTADEHYFSSLRVPAGNEQKDFDDLILAMTKILVDSLNEKELNKLISTADREGLKGSIARLERAFIECQIQDYGLHVKFLRDLQSLRSAGAAHRKGSNYRKIANELGIDDQSLREVFGGILVKGLAFLDFLLRVIQSGALDTPKASRADRSDAS